VHGFLESGNKNLISIKHGKFLDLLRDYFGNMSFSKAYNRVWGHGNEVQTGHPAKLPVLLGSSEERNSTALPSVKYPSIFRSESPDIITSRKPRQIPNTCLPFATF
jgi:hypothetical protein